MVYILLLLLLAFLGTLNFYFPIKIIRYTSYILLIAFCTLRYGVGYDYFSYQYIYNAVPDSFVSYSNYETIKGEILFLYIFTFFKNFGVSYEVANATIIFTINFLIIRFIELNVNVRSRVLSVTLLYSFYFVYIFSTLRQGLAIALFLNFALPLILKKKWKNYVIVLVLLSLIHSSILICLMMVFSTRYKVEYKYFPFLVFSALISVQFLEPLTVKILSSIGKDGYLQKMNINYGALLFRYLLFLVVYYLYIPSTEEETKCKNIYLIGFLIYTILSPVDLVASRLFSFYKILDIMILPAILFKIRARLLFINILHVLSFVIILSTISAMAYHSNLDIYDYPYVTIFNQEEFNYNKNLYEESF